MQFIPLMSLKLSDIQGTTITTNVGKTVTVTANGNPTTGFSWSVVNLPPFLSKAGEDYSNSNPSLIGGGGVFTFTFDVVDEGEGNVELVYARPWAGGESDSPTTFSVKATN